MMKVAFLAGFTLFLFSVKTVSAQTNITNDYIVISDVGVTNLSEYITALDAANWEAYRFQNQHHQFTFDNGFTIELKSAAELIGEGVNLVIGSYQTSLPSGHIPPILKLLPGNIIGMEIQNAPHKY